MEEKELYQMEIKELWNLFIQTIDQEDEEGTPLKQIYKEEIHDVRYGKETLITIWHYINHWYEEFPKTGKVKVKGIGKIKIEDFMEEKEKRETIMRRVIIENIDEGSTTKPR